MDVLEMEVHVERGIGYRPVSRHNEDTSAIDLLQIDAVFMPVRRVNYLVEETAVGEGGSARERLRLAARRQVTAYDWSTVTDQVLEVYDLVLGSGLHATRTGRG